MLPRRPRGAWGSYGGGGFPLFKNGWLMHQGLCSRQPAAPMSLFQGGFERVAQAGTRPQHGV